MFNIKKRRIIIPIVMLIVVGSLGFIFYNLNKWQTYNKTLTDANNAMSIEQYDKAIILYGQALDYRANLDLNKKIYLAKLLEKSKENYNTAIRQMTDKNYLTAIDNFKNVDKQDTERYKITQSKIDECKKLYIADNLKSANDSLSNSKFDDANKYVANVLKIDNSNSDAAKVKECIDKAAKEKTEVAVKPASSNSTSQTLNSNNSNKITADQALKIAKRYATDCTLEQIQHNLVLNGQEYYTFSVVSSDGGEWDSTLCVNAMTGALLLYCVDGTIRQVSN